MSDDEDLKGLSEYSVDVRERGGIWKWRVAGSGDYAYGVTGEAATRKAAREAALREVMRRCMAELHACERLLGLGLPGEIAALDRIGSGGRDEDVALDFECMQEARMDQEEDRMRWLRASMRERRDRYEDGRWLALRRR